VSAPDRANPSTRRGFRVGTPPLSAAGAFSGARARAATASHVRIARWSAYAWGAIGVTTTFIAVTCWWLTQDRSIPIYDAGTQLTAALKYQDMLRAGNLLGPFTTETVYPAFARLVGALGALIAGPSVASPIIAENLVFVSLLALGCYQTGRLVFGPLAGMLAVLFALGSPLVISMFHVFLLDAPLTALVAVSVWLMLASEDFSRPGAAALAGVTVGLGMNIKVQFAFFVVGLTVIMLAHGGWRNRRGLALFAVIALVIGAPWYLIHIGEWGKMLESASERGAPVGNVPPTLSLENLEWYFWSVLNSQLALVLFVLAVAGGVWTLVDVVRARGRQAARLEFLASGFAAWLVITFITPHHDIRYGLPLLFFLAVVATGWIACVPRAPRLAAIAILVLGVCANTLGIDFGVGQEVKVALANPLPATEQLPDQIVVYTPDGFLVSAPSRDGDVLGLLEGLHRAGVKTVTYSVEESGNPDFSYAGLEALAEVAKLFPVLTEKLQGGNSASAATLIHGSVGTFNAPACTSLSDGTDVWVARYDSNARETAFYCPTRHPQFYDPGDVG
jgi:hypothetical protein